MEQQQASTNGLKGQPTTFETRWKLEPVVSGYTAEGRPRYDHVVICDPHDGYPIQMVPVDVFRPTKYMHHSSGEGSPAIADALNEGHTITINVTLNITAKSEVELARSRAIFNSSN